jgi:uncharacterized protein
MDITPILGKAKLTITGYGDGGFKVNHEFIKGSLLLFPERSESWNVGAASTLATHDFQRVTETVPLVELLLIGTGKSTMPLHHEIKTFLKSKNIAVEIMDTGAACRTYNVLLSEERRVAAALIAV